MRSGIHQSQSPGLRCLSSRQIRSSLSNMGAREAANFRVGSGKFAPKAWLLLCPVPYVSIGFYAPLLNRSRVNVLRYKFAILHHQSGEGDVYRNISLRSKRASSAASDLDFHGSLMDPLMRARSGGIMQGIGWAAGYRARRNKYPLRACTVPVRRLAREPRNRPL